MPRLCCACAIVSSPTFTARVTPIFRARSSRYSERSVITTFRAPACSATAAAITPIGPAPVISTSSPTSGNDRAVCTALPNGSKIAATSRSTGSLCTHALLAGRATYSANAPGTWTPSPRVLMHRCRRPARQLRQRPQTRCPSPLTRSPTATSRTPTPISTTSPQNSWPVTIGTGTFFCAQWSQLWMCRSVPHSPVRSTLISTSSASIFGSGTSCNHSPGFASALTSAFTAHLRLRRSFLFKDPATTAVHRHVVHSLCSSAEHRQEPRTVACSKLKAHELRPGRTAGAGQEQGHRARAGDAGVGEGSRLLRRPAPDHARCRRRSADRPGDARAHQGSGVRRGRRTDPRRGPGRDVDAARGRAGRADARRVRCTQGGEDARTAAADRGTGREGPPGARGRGHVDHWRVGADRGRGAARGRSRGGCGRGDRGPVDRRAGAGGGGRAGVPVGVRPRGPGPRLTNLSPVVIVLVGLLVGGEIAWRIEGNSLVGWDTIRPR